MSDPDFMPLMWTWSVLHPGMFRGPCNSLHIIQINLFYYTIIIATYSKLSYIQSTWSEKGTFRLLARAKFSWRLSVADATQFTEGEWGATWCGVRETTQGIVLLQHCEACRIFLQGSGDGDFYPSTQRHYRRLIYCYSYVTYIATCFSRTTIIR
jgi:hypothetical protein